MSVHPAMDREFVSIGLQSSGVMNMNLDLGAHTYISREMRNGSAKFKAFVWNPHCGYSNGEAKEFVGIVENLWVSWSNLPVL